MHHQRFRGFSLLELLIAIALGYLICDAALQGYALVRRSFQQQISLTQLIEDCTFAEFFLHQTITQADFGGCRRISHLNLGEQVRRFGIYGYSPPHIPYHLATKAAPNSDIIVIAKRSSDWVTLSENIAQHAAKITLAAPLSLEKNQPVMITDCEHGDLLSADQTHRTQWLSGRFIQHSYRTADTQVGRLEEMLFFVGKNSRQSWGLYWSVNGKKPQELIAGVTNLEIRYGVPDPQTRQFHYRPAREITANEEWGKVQAVIIKLRLQHNQNIINRSCYIPLRSRSSLRSVL